MMGRTKMLWHEPGIRSGMARFSRARRRRDSGARAIAAGALVVLVMLVTAVPARADALRVQFPTQVAAGAQPKLVLIAEEAVDGVTVTLQDDAGRSSTAQLGPLPAGGQHQVVLPAIPGRHRFSGHITIKQGGRSGRSDSRPISFETVIAGRLEVQIDRARVDVVHRRLEARLSRPPARVEIAVISAASGEAVARAEQDLRGQAAGAPLAITWPAPPDDAGQDAEASVARIDLRFFDVDGFYTSVALLPWRMSIPHEEVVFANDSASIDRAEWPKLESTLAKIADAFSRNHAVTATGAVKLYVAGHTDTVGTPEHNLRLSRARAAAIASWFRQHRVRLPILCEGFGEHAPLVPTADETPEPRNRRVDYILALEDPIITGATSGFRPTWRPVR
jgi:outer membrane protein OmpA-like peptidoglycan-associated protein